MAWDDPNTPPQAGGLKSTLKIAVPLLVLGGVIFGITLLSLYTPKDAPDANKGGDGDDPAAGPGGLPPLVFFNTSREWDPPSIAPEHRNHPHLAPSRNPAKEKPDEFSLQDRIFPGFFEPGKTPRKAAFWFENPHPSAVSLQLKGVSCGACSGGRLAVIPPAVTRAYLERTALASLPFGLFNAAGVGLVDPAADFANLDWDNRKFSDDPGATYRVPAASASADRWSPQWGILELTFTVAENPKTPLTAAFASQVDGTKQTGGHQFAINFAPVPPLAASRPAIDVGEITQSSRETEYALTLYSATRGPGSEFGDLSPPSPSVLLPSGAPDRSGFVDVTKVERVPEAQLLEVAQETAKSGVITKVLAAYRVTVVVRPRVGDARLELGALKRAVSFGSGSATASVEVTGQVRGAVWLANEKNDVDIGTFKGRDGTTFVQEVVTESDAVELAVVKDECKPAREEARPGGATELVTWYQVRPKPARGGRGYFDLVVTVPKGAQFGALRDALAVLEVRPKAPATTPPVQRIRIPVKGTGSY